MKNLQKKCLLRHQPHFAVRFDLLPRLPEPLARIGEGGSDVEILLIIVRAFLSNVVFEFFQLVLPHLVTVTPVFEFPRKKRWNDGD